MQSLKRYYLIDTQKGRHAVNAASPTEAVAIARECAPSWLEFTRVEDSSRRTLLRGSECR